VFEVWDSDLLLAKMRNKKNLMKKNKSILVKKLKISNLFKNYN